MSPAFRLLAPAPGVRPLPRIVPGSFVALLVSFSGFCSLVYQVVWNRSVRTNFGGDNVSTAIVTGTFVLGLGIGAVLFGRAWRRPFRVYAAVEAAVGTYAIVSHALLASLARWLGHGFGGGIEGIESLRLPLVAACVVFLLPPCMLMGGTLPLMLRCFVSDRTLRSGTIGWLYGFNTLGAAIGTIAAPFYLLSRFDVPTTLTIVGCGNLLLVAGILAASRLRDVAASVAAARPARRPGRATASDLGTPSLVILQAAAAVTGFVALAYEVSLFRHLFVMNPHSPFNFPFVLGPFLLAMASGSALFTRLRVDDVGSALRRIAWLSLFAAAALVVAPAVAGTIVLRWDPVFSPSEDITGDLLYVVGLAAPLPFLLSGVFPLLVRLATRGVDTLPAATGSIYVANAIGSFCGALLVQFLGFEMLGAGGVLLGLALLCVCVAAWAVTQGAPRFAVAAWAAALAAWGVCAMLPRAAVEMAYTFGRPAALHQATPELVDTVEGATGVAMLAWIEGERFASVFVNGQLMSHLPDHPDHVALAGVVLSKPDPASILVLGLGGGGMVCELLKDPRVERLEVVDWSHELPRALELPRAKAILNDCLHEPRVRLWRADARVAVSLYDTRQFDVVLDNLTIPDWVGSTSIRSVEFFREVQRLLRPDGIYVSNNHGYEGTRAAVRAGLAQTFAKLWVHPRNIVLTSDGDPGFTPSSIDTAFAPRAKVLRLPGPPYAYFILDAMKRVPAAELAGIAAIRDDLLVHEYRYRSLPQFFRLWPRDVGARRST
jgi:spermidine synthase